MSKPKRLVLIALITLVCGGVGGWGWVTAIVPPAVNRADVAEAQRKAYWAEGMAAGLQQRLNEQYDENQKRLRELDRELQDAKAMNDNLSRQILQLRGQANASQ